MHDGMFVATLHAVESSHRVMESVPKIHPPKLVENDLRPITLTATLSKILESFVGGWILEAVGHQLGTNQYGALKERSTSHALK